VAAQGVAPDSVWLALLLFPVILAVSAAAGRRLLRWLRFGTWSPLEGFVFAAATGLGVLSYLLLAVGLLGAYNRVAFLLVLLALAAVGMPEFAAKRNACYVVPITQDATRNGLTASALAGGFLFGVMTLLGALAPPSSNDWDGLAYHLAAPKVYLRHGHIHFIPYDSHTNFPFTLDMLFGLGLSLAGAPLAKLFHWVTGILTALAVAVFCARYFPSRDGNKSLPAWAPPLAALFFLGVPQVAWEATSAYIDLGTALYQFLALYAVLAALASAGRASEPWWATAGLMSGWAMGTKMTAILPFGMLVAAAGVWALTPGGRHARRGVMLLFLLGAAVASPWYLKSAIWTHNPVYPFFYRIFPHSIHWTHEAEEAYRQEQNSFGLGRDAAALARAPWDVTMEGAAYFTVQTMNARRETVARQITDGDRRVTPADERRRLVRQGGNVWGSVGTTLLGLLPLWFFVSRRDRRVVWLLAYVGANFLGWFFLTQQTRYLLPVLAPASIVGALLLAWLEHGFLRVAAAVFVAVTLLINAWTTYVFTVSPVVNVVFGRESAERYLARTLPDLFPAMQFVNTLPPDSRVAFLQEVRGYYADRDYFWANPLQHTLIPYETLPDGGAWTAFLRDRLGITHVLVNENLARGSEGTAWYRLFRDAVDRGRLRTLYQVRGVGIYEIQ
jgi:4-amino-4-deoxy-L-arabinose transferase-like glycosyltransferase